MTCHLTGIYPDWWEGPRYDRPINAWCAGITVESTREIIQNWLLGDIGVAMGTGMIPKDKIVGLRKKTGVVDAVDTVWVRHTSGGISSLGFKSMEQGRGKFQGTERDVIWLDEEPEGNSGYDIFSEAKTRTMTKSDGMVLLTFTPLNGMNELCKYILERAGEDEEVKLVNITWSDAPHLGQKERDEMERNMLPHEREARMMGRPVIKSGLIYPFPESQISCSPFPIPNHWRSVAGLDIGWTAPTGAVQAFEDPQTSIIYVTQEYKRDRTEREEHAKALKTWGDGLWFATDPSANRTESDGRKTMKIYRDLGLNVHNADNNVELGIERVYELFASGKLKIFTTCRDLLEEIRFYQFDDKGKVKKKNDHILDALRYCVMALDKAQSLNRWRNEWLRGRIEGGSNGRSWKPGDRTTGY